MAFYINQVFLCGNVTQEPKLRVFSPQAQVCNFSMVTSYGKKNEDGWKEIPTFHNINIWGKPGEYISKTVEKGDKVTVSGRIETQTWEKDGVRNYRTVIVADSVIAMKKAPKNQENANTSPSQTPIDTEDIPF